MYRSNLLKSSHVVAHAFGTRVLCFLKQKRKSDKNAIALVSGFKSKVKG